MWRATLKSLLARKVRLLLTATAVVLGVGFMAGTYVLTDTLNAAFDDLFATTTKGVDVQVQGVSAFTGLGSGPGGGGGEEREPVPESVVGDVEAVAGVRQVVGNVQGYAKLVDPATGDAITPAGAPTIGSSWSPLAGLNLVEGRVPESSGDVAVDAGTSTKYALTVGERVSVIFTSGPREFTISGIFRIGDTDSLLGATAAAFDVHTAQEVMDRQGSFDYLSVVGDDGVTPAALRSAVSAVLPDGYEAITGADAAREATDQVSQGLGFLQTFLLVFALVSLFVGAFIIFNTFNIIVTQRVRELGLLRALGASRRQIMTSVVAEAFVTGLLASAVGIVAGIGIAIGLQALLKGFGIELPSTATKVVPRTIVVSLVLGTLVTVIASVAPARRAARVAPIEALRETNAPPTASLRRRAVSGGVLTALGVAMLGLGLFGSTGNGGALVGAGAALTFVGIAVLLPLFARPLASVIGRPFRRRAIPGRLGRENAMRSPRRTASTAAALMIGLGLVSFVAVSGASLKASANAALDRDLRSDFIVSTANFGPFSPQVAKDLAADPAFGAVSAIRQGEVRIGGSTTVVSAIDPSTFGQVVSFELLSGSLDSLSTPGTVLMSEHTATSDGLEVGDRVMIEFAADGSHPFTVGGIYPSDSILFSDYAISLDDYEQHFTQQLDTVAYVTVSSGTTDADARAAIQRVSSRYPDVTIQDQTEYKAAQSKAVDQFLSLVTALLIMALVIALFGIVNTLSLSIYERVRELGLLRAVGMSRIQVKRMIRVESVIISVLGALIGVAIGILFGIAMQQALSSIGITELAIPVPQLITYVVVAGVAGVVAAIVPARRAAKLNVLRSISYE